MADAAQQLQVAYQQIEQGNLQEARELLEEIRPQNENNPDFWWVYAHALEDEQDGRNALARVRQLAPNYLGLQELELEAGIRVAPPPQTLKRLQAVQSDISDDEDEFSMEGEARQTASGAGRRILYGVLGLIALLIIIFALLYASGMLGGGKATPTAIVAQATLETIVDTAVPTQETSLATEEPSLEPTLEPTTTEEIPTETPIPTETVVTDPFAALYPDITAYGVPDNGITAEQTGLGNSLVVATCSNPGPIANSNIVGIMDTFAAAKLVIPEDVEAIVFNIKDCTSNTVTLSLGIERDTFGAYLAGNSSTAALLQAMKRVA